MGTFDSPTLLLGFMVLLIPVFGAVMAITPYLMPKRECFAVTVPDSAVDDPFLRGLKRRYLCIILALTALETLAVGAITVADPYKGATAALVVGLLVLCATGYGLMLRFRLQVRRYKEAQGWVAEGGCAVGYVGDEPFPKPVSLGWSLLYLPILAITAGIGILGYSAIPQQVPMQMGLDGTVSRWADKSPGIVLFPVLFVLFIAACFIFSHWMIIRSKKGSDPALPAASAWAYGMFARAQSILLVVLGLLVSLVGPLMELAFIGAFTLEQIIAPIMVIVAVTVVASLAVTVVYGQNGSRLIARVGGGDTMLRDNDRYWKAGIFYVNRDDASLFLPERFGVGWTLNWGRPAAWVLVGAFALATIAFVVVSLLLT